MIKSGIYIIKNKVNGKIYIGQSINVFHRISQHKSDLKVDRRSNIHLRYSIAKYGLENFEFTIICLSKIEFLDSLERAFIKLYKSNIRSIGYNIDGGGNLNKEVSNETRLKQSLNRKGKKQPQSAKDIWRKNRIGEKNARARKVICTKTGMVWDFAKLAALENNIKYSTLVNKLRGKDKNDTTFKYLDDSKSFHKNGIPVIDIVTGKKWKDYKDAADELKLNPGTLRKWLGGQRVNNTNLRYAS